MLAPLCERRSCKTKHINSYKRWQCVNLAVVIILWCVWGHQITHFKCRHFFFSVIMYSSIKGQHIIYVFAKFQYQRCEEHPRKVKTVPYIKYSESRREFIVYTRRQMEKPGGKCELGNSLTKGSWQSCWEASVSFPDC